MCPPNYREISQNILNKLPFLSQEFRKNEMCHYYLMKSGGMWLFSGDYARAGDVEVWEMDGV